MRVEPAPIVASFRDPAGQLVTSGGRLLRVIRPAHVADFLKFLGTASFRSLVERRLLIGTRTLDGAESAGLLAVTGPALGPDVTGSPVVAEHERVAFPSFPYEWSPLMLHEAAGATLSVLEAVLGDGFGLKDATPYNVLFRGPDPVFVDLSSFERRDPGDPIWTPFSQFQRTFLYPLFVDREFGVPLCQTFLARRDGIECRDVYRLCSPLKRLSPRALTLVSIPTWLESWAQSTGAALYRPRRLGDPAKAAFVLRSLVGHLRRSLRRLKPRTPGASDWSRYPETHGYGPDDLKAKEGFVRDALREFRPARVLDVGCNTGAYSLLAAGLGARVVAVDRDPCVIDAVWRRARESRSDVLPMVVDVTRPSPGVGWRNRECAPFLDRARGGFDAVLMLAVVHHMLVTERIPLRAVLGLAAELTGDIAVVEFVAPDDPMFRRLARGRDDLYAGLTAEGFEAACLPEFEVVRSIALGGGTRRLYLLRKRGACGAP